MARHPEGTPFRNTGGRPWHPYALNCRFGRLRLAHGRQRIQQLGLMPPGIKRLDAARRCDPEARAAHEQAGLPRREPVAELAREHGTKWCLYNFRHSFAIRMLAAGADTLTVSALLGHADGAMLAKVYSHLSRNIAYLRDAVKAAGVPHEVRRYTPGETAT